MKRFAIAYKLGFALLGFSAIVTEIAVLAERGSLVPENFFSYFTVQANLFVVLVLILSALSLAAGKTSRRIVHWRGAATLYMIITGGVFSILLANIDAALTAVPWDNTVLHYLMPIAVVIDWLWVDPVERMPRFKDALTWISFPLAYLIFSLTRGSFIDWYPYPFMDPTQATGVSITITSFAITVFSVALIFMMTMRPEPKR